MATTYTLISSNVLTSSAASITFSSIPATYTDLVVRASARADTANPFRGVYLTLNSLTTSIYSYVRLYGNGSTAASNLSAAATPDNISTVLVSSGGSTANTFGNFEIYIPSYTASQKKQISAFGVQEDNASSAYISAVAELVNTTSAITAITLTATNFVSGSSFYLYGISNA